MRGKAAETRKARYDINGKQYQCYFKGNDGPDRKGDLVFFNGFFYGSSSWAYQTRIPELLKNYRMVMFDYPCQGASSSVRDKINAEVLVSDFISLLSRIEVKSALLVGHSLGGFLAGMLAGGVAGQPLHEQIKGLMVVNSSLYSPLGTDKFFREIQRRMQHIGSQSESAVNAQGPIKDLFRLFLPMAMGDDYLAYIEDYEETLLDAYAQYNSDPLAVASLIDGMLASNKDVEKFRQVLAHVTCPVRIVSGGSDKIFPPVMSSLLAGAYSDAKVFEVANAGHSVMVEQHREFNRLLLDFIATLYPENTFRCDAGASPRVMSTSNQ